jgi:hypothetical protein
MIVAELIESLARLDPNARVEGGRVNSSHSYDILEASPAVSEQDAEDAFVVLLINC